MLTTSEIESLARQFTEKLQDIVDNSGILKLALGPFPNGGCRLSSRIFGFVLERLSTPTAYMVGKHVSKENQTHAWLQLDSPAGICIIDLTCSQFEFCDLPCPYVSDDCVWHLENWTIENRQLVADLDTGNGFVAEGDIIDQMLQEMEIAG